LDIVYVLTVRKPSFTMQCNAKSKLMQNFAPRFAGAWLNILAANHFANNANVLAIHTVSCIYFHHLCQLQILLAA